MIQLSHHINGRPMVRVSATQLEDGERAPVRAAGTGASYRLDWHGIHLSSVAEARVGFGACVHGYKFKHDYRMDGRAPDFAVPLLCWLSDATAAASTIAMVPGWTRATKTPGWSPIVEHIPSPIRALAHNPVERLVKYEIEIDDDEAPAGFRSMSVRAANLYVLDAIWQDLE